MGKTSGLALAGAIGQRTLLILFFHWFLVIFLILLLLFCNHLFSRIFPINSILIQSLSVTILSVPACKPFQCIFIVYLLRLLHCSHDTVLDEYIHEDHQRKACSILLNDEVASFASVVAIERKPNVKVIFP